MCATYPFSLPTIAIPALFFCCLRLNGNCLPSKHEFNSIYIAPNPNSSNFNMLYIVRLGVYNNRETT